MSTTIASLILDATYLVGAGAGWRIGGLSAIHRCVKNTAAASVRLDARDALCLDGEPLVLVSGAHLAAGAKYRMYRESFAKVLARSAGGTLWFEAKLPDGSTRRYGDTVDSRLDVALLSRSGAREYSPAPTTLTARTSTA